MPDADEIFSAEELASLPEWPEEPPLDCPHCEHVDLDHDETGCTVDGCPCTGP